MLNKNTGILAAVIFAFLFWATCVFTVSETEQAIVLEFKKIVAIVLEPGIKLKLPYQQVRKFDKRLLTLESSPERFLTSEKKNVQVDWFVKWHIDDVAKHYKAVGGDVGQTNIRLDQITKDAMRSEFSKRTIREVVSSGRGEMRDVLTKAVNPVVDDLGIEVDDIRVMRVDLPDEVSTSVYRRMEAERARVAREFRSRGAEAAERIRADADRQREVLLAEAYRDAEIRRGEGDAIASDTYAKAYGKDRDFFQFYRSLAAYRQAFKDENDMIVLEPNTEFLQYFRKSK